MQPLSAYKSDGTLEDFRIDLFVRGDQDAFRKVHDRLAKALYYFAFSMTGSDTGSEDIVASAFVRLYENRAAMQQYEHIKRWIFVTTRHLAVDHLRTEEKKRVAHEGFRAISDKFAAAADLEMLKTSILQSLLEEVEKLPGQRRTILKMYFFEQKTTAEIAGELELKEQTVLNHKTRALDALRKTVLFEDWLPASVIPVLLRILIELAGN